MDICNKGLKKKDIKLLRHNNTHTYKWIKINFNTFDRQGHAN